MNLRPNITFNGSYESVKPLQERLQSWLPKESVEWQRSYGRGTRQVNVHANFVFFQPALALFEPRGRIAVGLHQIPVLHLFWVGETDLASFAKSGNRDSLIQWMKLLQDRQCPNYLIIVVEEVRKTGKNATIFDKVRSEFSSKQPTRCCSVRMTVGGGSSSSLDSPSLTGLVTRIRQLIVQALTRIMQRSEDYVREMREQCRSARWHYSDHFLLQEQLAFLLEMWGCLNESLVQYDELDAMLSQFINNTSSGEQQPWLEDICIPAEEFEGVPLGKTITMKYRQLLKDRCATLLDVRNHLFMRQAALLCDMGRGAEVAKRALPFLHATLHEIEVLRIENIPGVTESWVYFSCFQVADLIDTLLTQPGNDQETTSMLALNKARLLHYAQQKLYRLGMLAGLTADPVPEERRIDVPRLITGCIAQKTDSEGAVESDAPSHLCKALCSSENFKTHYVELSEQARSLFAQQGRHRQASVVCIELAKYYVLLADYSQAEPLLQEACSVSGGSLLPSILASNLSLLAKCWKELGKTQKYLIACSVLASSTTPLSDDLHEHYLSCLESHSLESEVKTLPGKPLVVIGGVTTSTPEVRPRQPIKVSLTVVSNAVRDIQCQCVSLHLHSLRAARRFTAHEMDSARLGLARSPLTRSTVVFDEMDDITMSSESSTADSTTQVSLSASSDDRPMPKGPEELEFLFSSSPSTFDSGLATCNSRDILLTAKDVRLHPGCNVIELVSESTVVGHLTAASAVVHLGSIRLAYILNSSPSLRAVSSMHNLASLASSPMSHDPEHSFTIDVVPAEPSYSIQFQLATGESRFFHAGTKETVLLSVGTADDVIEHFVSLILTPIPGMSIDVSSTLEGTIKNVDSDVVEDVTITWYLSEGRAVVFSLPAMRPHSRLTIPMVLDLDATTIMQVSSEVAADAGPAKMKTLPVVTHEVHAVLDDAAVEHTETILCTFCTPVQLSHTGHATPDGTLLSVSLTSHSNCPLEVEMRAQWRDGGRELLTAHHKQSVIKTRLQCHAVHATLWSLPDHDGGPKALGGKVEFLLNYSTRDEQNLESTSTNRLTYQL